MRDMMENDIAIIGYAFDFPNGTDSNEKFWDVLKNGKDLVREIPKERWDWEKIYDSDPNAIGKSYSYHGAFLENIEQFDASAFRIMPVEAKNMDPQQRLVLKTSWRAMENSYLNIEELKHSDTGVFIGATMDDYQQLQTRVNSGKNINRYTHFGSVLNDISGRVSYVYGFQGPSMTIDTACSSSMVAIDSAIKALKSGDCEIALAGGVNVILTEEMYIKFSRTQMLSRTGACKTFDDSADGYVRGEGCGILVLQKLKDARAAGRHILAVIRGSSVNHNGNSGGLTVPSGKAQIRLLQSCMQKAGVLPGEIDYIEAHGTGTQLGDKIEVNSLQEVFKSRKKPVYIGSVKTNMGHLESAAGVAGIIKVLLCMENNELVPSIHLQQKNKKINWENSSVDVIQKNISWTNDVKIAGISAFGASGTNGHVIIEKYKQVKIDAVKEENIKLYLAISAKKSKSLKKLAQSVLESIENKEEPEIREFCKVYNLVRSDYSNRIVVCGANKEEFISDFIKKVDKLSDTESHKQVETRIICNFKDSLKIFEQFIQDNERYRQMVDEYKQEILFESDKKKSIVLGSIFIKFIKELGLKDCKLVGNNTVKFQLKMLSQPLKDYNDDVEKYIQNDVSLLNELEKYENDNYEYSDEEVESINSLQDYILEQIIHPYESGARIRWDYFYNRKKINFLHLPGYEFDESYYWIDHERHSIDDLHKTELLSDYLEGIHKNETNKGYEYTFQLRKMSNLVKQHCLFQREVLVGTFQVKMIQEIANEILAKNFVIKELFFLQKIEPEEGRQLKIQIAKGLEQRQGSILEQNENDEWVTKTMFTLVLNESIVEDDFLDETESVREFVKQETFYKNLSQRGLMLGPDYKIIEEIVKNDIEAIALIRKTNFEPAILDSASQLLFLYIEQDAELYLPYHFDGFEQRAELSKVNRVEAKVITKTEDEIIGNLSYYYDDLLIAAYKNYHLKRVEKKINSLHTIVGKCAILPNGKEIYQNNIKIEGTSLQDHVVYHQLTIPGAYFISQMMQLAEEKYNQPAFELHNINFYNAMVLEENTSVKEIIQVSNNDEGYSVDIASSYSNQEEYLENVKMLIKRKRNTEIPVFEERIQQDMLNKKHMSKEEIISVQWKIGLNLSDTFHWIQTAWVSEEGVLAELSNESFEELEANYGTPPGLIDTAVQILGLVKNINQDGMGAYIPMTIDSIIQYQKLRKKMNCYVSNVRDNSSLLTADILYWDSENHSKVLEFKGITLMKADRRKFGKLRANDGLSYEEIWNEVNINGITETYKYSSAIELRFGILNDKLIFTRYQKEETQWRIVEKLVLPYIDKDIWKEKMQEALKKSGESIVIISDSTADILVHSVSVEKINELSIVLTKYYLEMLRILQDMDVSNHLLCFLTSKVYSEEAEKNNVLGRMVWGLIRSVKLELLAENVLLLDSDKSAGYALNTIEKCFHNNIVESRFYDEQIKLPSVEVLLNGEEERGPYVFDSKATYVVIGGFGALGMETCKRLINSGVKRLLIIGRSKMDEKKGEYEELQLLNEDVKISYEQLDLSVMEAEGKLAEIFAKELKIGGVIYAAGVVKDRAFYNYTREDIQLVYQSKVNGVLVLAKVLDAIEFDFCVCFSSIVSVIGAAGQSVYGAANGFVDALCDYERVQGKNMFAIQWGPWAEIGMFAQVNQVDVERYENRNIYTMKAKEAMDEFVLGLNHKTNILIVNKKEKKKNNMMMKEEPVEHEKKEQSIAERIKNIIATAIGMSNVDLLDETKTLMEFGIDSLLMIELRMKINKSFKMNFSLDELFNQMTVAKLIKETEKKQ